MCKTCTLCYMYMRVDSVPLCSWTNVSMRVHRYDNFIPSILSNWEVIKYHKIISVVVIVVIELSVRCLNTGPKDRLS